VNIFEVGSKNPGATNVRRVLGKGPGNLVFARCLKGAAASWALAAVPMTWRPRPAGSPALPRHHRPGRRHPGHSFSCFTGFRGGKSVATGAGGFLMVFPIGMGIAFVVFI
jgi:glycerol-3-phosphate acyltransferase PlsY